MKPPVKKQATAELPMIVPHLERLVIEITNRCNFQCKMCIRMNDYFRKHQRNSTAFMPVKTFQSLVDQYKELPGTQKYVIPQFQGESLLHPDFIEMCEYLQAQGFKFGFTTNAQLLTREVVDQLAKLPNFTSVSFSFDSYDKKTFEAIRIGSQFEEVVENIRYFIEVFEQRVTPNFNMVMLPENENHYEDTYRFLVEQYSKLNINRFSFSASYVCDEDSYPTKTNFTPPRRVACKMLNNYMAVLTNGAVTPCCGDPQYKIKLGNVFRTSLSEVWYGAAYAELRKLHKDQLWNRHPVCNHCLSWVSGLGERQTKSNERTGVFYKRKVWVRK